MNHVKTKEFNIKERFLSKFNFFDKINRPARSSLSFTLINLFSKAAAFLFTPIFTRILTGAQYGEYSLFTSYLSLALALGSLELSGGVVIRAFQKYKERTNITVMLASGMTSILIGITVSLLFFTKLITGGGMAFPFAYVLLLFNALSSNITNIYLSKCRYRYKWLPSLVISFISSLLAPLCSILIITILNSDNINHVSAKVGTITFFLSLTASVLLFISIRGAASEIKEQKLTRNDLYKHGRDIISLLLKLSLPMLPYYFSVMLISQADKIMISEFIGKEALGKYSVAYSAGIAATAMTSGLTSALCPWIMRKVRAREGERIRDVLDAVISICAGVIICFLCFAPDIFKILAPESYFDALPVLFISASIPIPLAIAQCASGASIASEKVVSAVFCGIIPAAFSLFLGYLLIPGGNLFIPAFITAASYLLLSIGGIINTRRILGSFIVSPVLSLMKLFTFACAAAALLIFKSYIPIRAAIFALSAAILFIVLKRSLVLLTDKIKEQNKS